MKASLYLIALLTLLGMAGGCSRCERPVEPDPCEGAMGRMNLGVHIHQYVYQWRLGERQSLNPPAYALYTMRLDTIYDQSENMLIHGSPCDSVKWLVGNEGRWRKGDSTLIHFRNLPLGQPFRISKRVWGQRAPGCDKVLEPYYETSRIYPTARSMTIEEKVDGVWAGLSTLYPGGHTITMVDGRHISTSTFAILDLVPGWPTSPWQDGIDWRVQGVPGRIEYNGNMIYFAYDLYIPNIPHERWSKTINGYMGILRYPTRDSLTIEYVRGGIDQPGNHQFFRGKRVR